MNCKEINRKLSAYIDNELPAREKELLSAHLSACGACREEFEVLAAGDVCLSKLSLVAPSASFRPRFWQKVRKAEGKGAENRSIRGTGMLRWIPVPVACSIVIVLFSAFSIFSPVIYGMTRESAAKGMATVAARTFADPASQKVFAPLNFLDFCNRCRHMTCDKCHGEGCPHCAGDSHGGARS